MKVLIFTEGGGKSGLGHASRCLALYKAFEAAGAETELVLDGDDAAAGLLRGTSCTRLAWRGPRGLALIGRGDIAVVDSYKASLPFYRKAAGRARLLVSLDDTKRIRYPRGLVVNGAVAASRLRYPGSKGVGYLLGPRYTPLRPEFSARPRRRYPARLIRVLITMGGGDTSSLALRLAQYLRRETGLTVETLRPGGKLNADAIRNAMLRADVCVTACGQTTYELAACGTPQLGVGFADNQRLNMEGWVSLRAMRFAGWAGDKKLFEKVLELLQGWGRADRAATARRARAASDGKGAARVAAAVLAAAARVPEFRLRRARISDSRKIFELSNSPEVRSNSINTAKIEWAGHRRWYAARLKDPRYLFLVSEIAGRFAGQLRYEIGEGESLVSVSVAADFRGMGLASPLLREGSSRLFRAFPAVKRINAYVRPSNKASARAFLKAGYVPAGRAVINDVRLEKYVARRN